MKKSHIALPEADKLELDNFLSKGKQSVRAQKRAHALLLLNQNKTYQEVSDSLGITYATVLTWAKKYRALGLDFLQEKPRSGRPIGINGEEMAKITAIACTKAPEGYGRWSLRLLADRIVELEILPEISHSKVGQILKKTNFNRTENANGASHN